MPSPVELVETPETTSLDLLNSDLEKDEKELKELIDKADKEDKVEEPEKEEEKVELKEGEEKDEKEEKIELDESKDEYIAPVSRKEILAAYPDLFKKFPYLERAMYRDREYTELFPSVEEARQSVERLGTLQNAESELFSGKQENILKAVKAQDENAYYKLVDDFLPMLERTDQKAYLATIGNVGRHFVARMWQEGAKLGKDTDGGKALQQAAATLSTALFGKAELKEMERLAKPEDPNANKVAEERAQQLAERYSEVADDLDGRVQNTLFATIEQYIDPKQTMSEYVRDNAMEDCLEYLDEAIEDDTQFKPYLDSLWKQAMAANYSRASQDKIKAAYLSKAKSLLPGIIQRVRKEAGQQVSSKRVIKEEDREEKPSRSLNTPRRAAPHDSSDMRSRNDGRRKSTLDILNED